MLDPGEVARRLRELAPAAPAYHVALSGGRDSLALLHALAAVRGQLPGRLCAVHVDHGLHPDAPAWAAHCEAACAALGVALRVH
ncbi:ATP-binding protein, partial [Halorhodospira neutriphila]|uniref:ATP-binding protein n=1 Tax=Halorhodospira neutriphila TaxID=168379 RepID=UPI0030842B52